MLHIEIISGNDKCMELLNNHNRFMLDQIRKQARLYYTELFERIKHMAKAGCENMWFETDDYYGSELVKILESDGFKAEVSHLVTEDGKYLRSKYKVIWQ